MGSFSKVTLRPTHIRTPLSLILPPPTASLAPAPVALLFSRLSLACPVSEDSLFWTVDAWRMGGPARRGHGTRRHGARCLPLLHSLDFLRVGRGRSSRKHPLPQRKPAIDQPSIRGTHRRWDKKERGPVRYRSLRLPYLPTVLLTAHPVCLQHLLYPQTEALCHYTNERTKRLNDSNLLIVIRDSSSLIITHSLLICTIVTSQPS